MNKKAFFKRAASLALAVVMVLSMLVVVNPQDVEAASKDINRNMGTLKNSKTKTEKFTETDLMNSEGKGKYVYIKFKPADVGYVTVKLSPNTSSEWYNNITNKKMAKGKIALCDSKKKLLSRDEDFYAPKQYTGDDTVTYGVVKDTYYLRLTISGSYLGQSAPYPTDVKVTFKKLKKSYKNSMKKATTLAAKKKVTGIFAAGNSKNAKKNQNAHWYKIKLNKQKRVVVSLNVKSCGDTVLSGLTSTEYLKDGIKVTFYKSNGKKFLSNSFDYASRYYPESVMEYRRKDNYGKIYGLKKGTYYIKVERANKKSSGMYTLSWKMK